LLLDAGLRIKDVRGVPAPFPKVLGNGWLGNLAVNTNVALIAVSKTLFSYQIFVTAEWTPDVDFVLRDAKEKSAFAEQREKQASGRWSGAASSAGRS
jgi:hypothetical protein